MNDYELKQEDRRERLERAAERARSESDAAFNRSRALLDPIPLGQPILPGHHSEGRHRRTLKRADDAMRRACEADRRAKELARRAESVGSAGISQDDPDAIEKLRAKLDEMKAAHEEMVKYNKAWRKGGEAGLIAIGLTPEAAAIIKAGIDKAYSWDKQPYAKYQIANSSNNIRRVEQRIAALSARAETPEREPITGHGWKLYDSTDLNRTCFHTDTKPSEDIRKQLKSYGFRWSPRESAWMRHRSDGAWHWAHEVGKKIDDASRA
jgi:hypothetical protein